MRIHDVKVRTASLEARLQGETHIGAWHKLEEDRLTQIMQDLGEDSTPTPWKEVQAQMDHTWSAHQCHNKWYVPA